VTASATGRAPGRVATASTLLAALAGVVDLWAVTSLGGPFAGVVTGNLVTLGAALGRGEGTALWPPLVAVAGFAAGVGAWSLLWRRRPAAVARPLLVELAVLVVLAVAWVVPSVPTPVLLAGAALAMGGQSSTALRLGESTTYLTGTLTGGVAAAVTGGPPGRVAALRQLVALVAGAVLAVLLLGPARWSVPVLAVALLVTAVVVLGRPGGADRSPR
jgi:uncharacterized membrane protein YoaK (UPF0700 family)